MCMFVCFQSSTYFFLSPICFAVDSWCTNLRTHIHTDNQTHSFTFKSHLTLQQQTQEREKNHANFFLLSSSLSLDWICISPKKKNVRYHKFTSKKYFLFAWRLFHCKTLCLYFVLLLQFKTKIVDLLLNCWKSVC